MLSTGGRAHSGEKPAADAEFGKGPEPGPLVGLVTADGCQQAQHPLLDQILTVSPRQEQGACADTHQAGITENQSFLGSTVACGNLCA